VFAGEDIECTITFKNVAPPEGRNGTPARRQNGFATAGDRQRKLPVPPVHSSTRPSVSRNSSFTSQLPPAHLRGHRPALSLHTPSTPGGHQSPVTPSAAQANSSVGGQVHGRSVSIISLGTEVGTETSNEKGIPIRRPARGHARSASLQVVPGRPNSYPSTTTAGSTTTSVTMFLWLTRQQLPHLAIDQQRIPPRSLATQLLPALATPATSPSLRVRIGDGRASQPHQVLQPSQLPGGNPQTPSLRTSNSLPLPRRRTIPYSRHSTAVLPNNHYMPGAIPHSHPLTAVAFPLTTTSRCSRLSLGLYLRRV
jgi:hypothetical protein